MMRALFFAVCALPCAAQNWISIATPSTPWQYFRYSKSGAIEKDKFDAHNPHPQKSFTYRFPPGPSAARTTCRLEDRPSDNLFWYAPDGRHLDGAFATPLASEFTVSARQENISGFEAEAIFGGHSSTPGGALESIYFTDRACSDGGVEYGFARDIFMQNILVYWSTYSNCGNNAGGTCRKTNDPAPGDDFSNVQQESNLAPHGFRIYHLIPSQPYRFRMLVEDDGFRVEVYSGAGLAKCSDQENGPRQPCTFHKSAGSWFPIHGVGSGYIVAGALDVANSQIDDGSSLRVFDIRVAANLEAK